MSAYLARTGLAVFAMVFAITFLTEHAADGRALAAEASTMEPPQLHEVAAPPAQNDGIVIASWYGPGFYGNRTACGQTYTPEILGVAIRHCRAGLR
jgi:rare lipoprotein A (peptidoglycan hydrolase)